MSRRLIIMRHAKSDWDSAAPNDFDRPLARRGERDAPRVARWLQEQQLVPEHVISSPALRARETALRVVWELRLDEKHIDWADRIYEAEVRDLLEVLAGYREKTAITLLVGHNPGLEQLVRYLAQPATLPREDKLLPTAGIIVLELPDDWRVLPRGKAQVVTHMRPRWLTD